MINLIVLLSPSSFYASFLPFSFVMARPPVSLPSFSHFAEVFSPFLQLTMCSFLGSSKKSEEQEEETRLHTGFPSFPSSPFFFFFLTKYVSPFFFTGVDTGVRDPELLIPEGAVGSIQAASFQTA